MGTSRFAPRALAAGIAAMIVAAGLSGVAAADDLTAAGYRTAAPAGLSRPATVPSLDGWDEGVGSWTLGEGTRVVADETLASRADMLSTELTAFSGLDVPAVTGDAGPADVSLVLDETRRDELGAEGFALDIGKDGFKVIGASDIGVFYGTRSVSQMLRQGQLTLPAGTVTSTPAYEERGATLCACQINVSTDWIDRFLSDMADLRLNYVLMEMKLKPNEENTKRAEAWSYYTADDVRAFVAKAKDYGIDVIPEINSPGHMNIWLENYPEYQLVDRYGNRDSNRLDISSEDAVDFYKTLIDEYDGAFDTDYWHMGADEYMMGSSFANYPQLKEFAEREYGAGATANDAFTGFINEINDYVKAKGKRLRIWNDGIVSTKNVTLDKDVIVEYWQGTGRQPSDLASNGYELMNASQALYWSRSAKSAYTVNPQYLYDNGWNAGVFDGWRRIDKNYEGLRGAKVSIWPDRSDLQTENEVEQEIFYGMRFIAQMTWSDSRPWADWTAMKASVDSIGYPLAIRQYVYQPLEEGTYDIPGLDAAAQGPWNLRKTPDGYYQMVQADSGKCLSLRQGVGDSSLLKEHLNVVTQVGARPELVECVDTDVTFREDIGTSTAPARNQQKWQIRTDKDGLYTITPALTQQRLAVATGQEEHIDLTLMDEQDASLRPQAGQIAQFPHDLVGDNALFAIEPRLGMSATATSTEATPASPVDITVKVQAANGENTGDVTVTPTVPEGWTVLPASVDLKSVPAGKSAKAVFRVVNTTGEGAADIAFAMTGADGTELARTSIGLIGKLTFDVRTSDYAADSVADTIQERAPVANAFDKNPNTYWHTKWDPTEDLPPHWIAFKASMDGATLATVTELPRQGNNNNGMIRRYQLYVVPADTAASVGDMTDEQWGAPVAHGEFPKSTALQTITVPDGSVPAGDVYVKLVGDEMFPGKDAVDPANFTSVAELNATAVVTPVEIVAPDQPDDNPVAVEADKTALAAAVEKADALNEDDYTAESWERFQTALSAAKAVLDDANATQERVDAALGALEAAAPTRRPEPEPEPTPVDRTALAAALSEANAMSADGYTADSWARFDQAREAARTVMDDDKATQDDVDQALGALAEARDALVKETPKPEPTPVDRTALAAAVEKAGALIEADYTADSWTAFATALADARRALADETAAQEVIDGSLAALNGAIDALVKAETPDPDPDPEPKPDPDPEPEPTDPDKPSDPAKPSKPGTTGTADTKPTIGATGAAVTAAIVVALLAGTAGAIGLAVRRRGGR